jgi:hypothetical protein
MELQVLNTNLTLLRSKRDITRAEISVSYTFLEGCKKKALKDRLGLRTWKWSVDC